MKRIFFCFLAIALAAGIVACATPDRLRFTPGTYRGTALGYGAGITVEVSVDRGRILDVRVVEHTETTDLPLVALAFERIPQAIVNGQTLAVDMVAGATFTSFAITQAASEALRQSGVNMTALQQRRAAAVARTSATVTTDVLVIGAGGAGLSAAMSARQNGARVIVLEKMPLAGGNTILVGESFNSVNPELQSQLPMNPAHHAAIQALINTPPQSAFETELQQTVRRQLDEHVAQNRPGLFDSVEWHMLQTYVGGYRLGKPEFIRIMAEEVVGTRHWMTEHGMRWSASPNIHARIFTVSGGLWQRANRPEMPLGTGFIDMGVRYIQRHSDQITLKLETRATELIVEGGRVTGVRATSPTTDYTITATGGVILATGGFGANREMREQHNIHWPSLLNAHTTNHPGATGDGIIMAERVGANLIDMEWIQLLSGGDPRTGTLTGVLTVDPVNHLRININGDRFVDENAPRDDMARAVLEQPNSMMWMVVDSRVFPDRQNTRTHFGDTIEELIASGRAYEAATIEELAAIMNVPAENLRRAVDEFNAGVEAGVDRFGRRAWRDRVDQAPFFASPRVPTVHHTMGGVQIDTETRVINTQGQIIPGLFAAGEVASGIHGANRLGGNALSDIHVFGRIAGASAAGSR